MAKDYDDVNGVWRTIGGRRVFIKDGQSLAEAMVQSGKFKNLRSTYKKEKEKELDHTKKETDKEPYAKTKEEKEISAKDLADELQNADIGDWNNMNQQERDEVCKDILAKAEEKYGDKLKDDKFRKEVTDKLTDENFHTMTKVIDEKYGSSKNSEKLSKSDSDLLEKLKGEDRERQAIARDIVKELDPSLKNASETLLDKRASELMTYNDGEVLEKGEKPYTNRFGELERSTESLKKWRDNLENSKEANKPAGQKTADLIKESGVKTFADEIKESEKYASAKREGFGDYNKDNIPVYNNKIDYTGDFGRNADLSTLSNNELKEAIRVQQQKLDEANSEKIGDQRTRNGKMDKIFNTARKQQYEEGVKLLKEESIRRENAKNPEYEKKGYGVKYYSVEDAMKDPNSKMNQYIRIEKERKAYKKYLKLHPNSEISFEDFKDMRKQ